MNAPSSILYADRLVRLTAESIRFSRYYFPVGSKTVPLTDIERIEAAPASLVGNGRLWGTDDFKTWFPCDFGRLFRKRIYLLYRRSTTSLIGFTVLDDTAFQAAMSQAGIASQPADPSKFAVDMRITAKIVAAVFVIIPFLLIVLAVLTLLVPRH